MAKMENTPSKNQKKLNSHLPSLWILRLLVRFGIVYRFESVKLAVHYTTDYQTCQ